ncbi:MAG: ABC transporter permease [Verrucomicrobia bacterium]|nr:ABC transporter permease [Verrucomicrobiota bacterium]MBS0645149.1 ABC transporter permease [Verrucomicrobiota bacterium]
MCSTAIETPSTQKKYFKSTYWYEAWKRLCQNKLACFGLFVLCFLFVLAILGPIISPYLYYQTHLELKNQPPNLHFWFGTDDLGRDLFTRTCMGARISLFVGMSAAFIDVLIGVLWGGIAALAGGRLDTLMMRIADILYAIPYLLIVIMLMVVLGSGLVPILIALTIIGWIGMARIVRGQLIQLKQAEFIEAAIALGAGYRRIFFKHLLPNALGPIIVTMTLTIPTAIFAEAFLSFLGLGIQAPMASWGSMANDGLPALRYYPWRLFFPAFFISMTMLAFNLVGDGLRDAFDPKLKK